MTARRMVCAVASLVLLLTLLPSGLPGAAASDSAGLAFSTTKTVTREQLVGGVTQTVDSKTITLSVSQTQNLRGFQPVDVRWTGAHLTGDIPSDPNDGAQGAIAEFPMVLLECRGVDDPGAPPDQRLDPTTCWTAYEGAERGGVQPKGAADLPYPPWRLDMYADPSQRVASYGLPPDPNAVAAGTTQTVGQLMDACQNNRDPVEYWLPFKAASGAVYYPPVDCLTMPQPPEAAGSQPLTFPSNETYAASFAPAGTGQASFDILTANENASLGCSDSVACALVAVPIMGISCDDGSDLPAGSGPSSSAVADCMTQGTPGGAGLAGGAGQLSVSGRLWWTASNWRNRITVPLGFAPIADPCSLTGGPAGELDIYGSELMAQATSQWDPHFCQNSKLFTLKHIQNPEPFARSLLAQGNVPAVFAAYDPPGTFSGPVVNAPVALSGFAISFNVDDSTGNPVTTLRLTPRLLAKLLTESYATDPSNLPPTATVSGNPINLANDREFQALNPQVGILDPYGVDIDSMSTLYALSSDSDVMYALTSYIMSDPEARAWLNGAPDPWGMRVNQSYNLSVTATSLSLPTASWPLLDTSLSSKGATIQIALGVNGCPALDASPYLGLVAAPASRLAVLAQAVQFAWPLSNTGFNTGSNAGTGAPYCQVARDPRTGPGGRVGARFVLAVTSLGEAARFGLHTASLQTNVDAAGSPASPATATLTPAPDRRTFVAPSAGSLRAAADLVTFDKASQLWQFSPDAVHTSAGAGAYPGTMVVQTEVPTSGLPAPDARNLAAFLNYAAGPGQQPGIGIGQLPDGYLPMTQANGMGALVAYTKQAAVTVANQSGAAPTQTPETGAPPPVARALGLAAGTRPGTGASPAGGSASGTATRTPSPPVVPAVEAAKLAKTVPVRSQMAGLLAWLALTAAICLGLALTLYAVAARRIPVRLALSRRARGRGGRR